MCIDDKTSITSFIIGSIINIIVMLNTKQKVIYQLCVFWQWILMVQLAEFLIWSDKDCGIINYTGTKLAIFFTLTQPIVLFFVFFFMSDKPKYVQIISMIIILLYIGYFFNYLNTQKEYKCVKKEENCPALNLEWANTNNYFVYILTLLLITFLLSDNSNPIFFFIVYSTVTVIISKEFYWCGAPSMWCWFAVPFPILLGLFSAMIKN